MSSELDKQVGGDHYKKLGIYQPWVVYSKWMTPEELKGAMKKEVFAYLQREASKGGREDIRKAHHTLGIYLELTEPEKKIKPEEGPKWCKVSDAKGKTPFSVSLIYKWKCRGQYPHLFSKVGGTLFFDIMGANRLMNSS